MKVKKVSAALVVAVVAFAFAGCASGESAYQRAYRGAQNTNQEKTRKGGLITPIISTYGVGGAAEDSGK